MTIIALVPLVVAIAGALVYALSTNAKAAEMGRLMFACGLLVTLWVMSGHVLRI